MTTPFGRCASAPCRTEVASIPVMHGCNNASRVLSSALVFRSFARLICCQPAESAGLVRGYMDDLIGRIGAAIGVDRTAAEKAGVLFRNRRDRCRHPRSWPVRQIFDGAAGQEAGELDVLLDQRHRRYRRG